MNFLSFSILYTLSPVANRKGTIFFSPPSPPLSSFPQPRYLSLIVRCFALDVKWSFKSHPWLQSLIWNLFYSVWKASDYSTEASWFHAIISIRNRKCLKCHLFMLYHTYIFGPCLFAEDFQKPIFARIFLARVRHGEKRERER